MKIYFAPELKSAYRLNGSNLEYAPIETDGTISTDVFDYVEPELVGDEKVVFLGKTMTFNDAYKIITQALSSTPAP